MQRRALTVCVELTDTIPQSPVPNRRIRPRREILLLYVYLEYPHTRGELLKVPRPRRRLAIGTDMESGPSTGQDNKIGLIFFHSLLIYLLYGDNRKCYIQLQVSINTGVTG